MRCKIKIILICVLISLTLQAQTIDSVAFRVVAVNYVLKNIEINKNKRYSEYKVEYADTNRIKLYIPELMLREINHTSLNYQALRPYIDENFNPYSQEFIIEKKEGLFVLHILKGEYEENMKPYLKEGFTSAIGENNYILNYFKDPDIYELDLKNPYMRKKIPYKRLLAYAYLNPRIIFFKIYRLPGIWAYKNNKIIKLIFHEESVEEMDGEEYYRSILFPFSPQCIKRVINGDDFMPYICT